MNAVVNLNNVHVKNTVINGMNKVGTLVGQNQSGTVKVTDCTIENVTVNCSEGEAGKVIGAMNQGAKATFDKAFSEDWVKDVTLNLVKGAFDRKTVALADGSTIKFTKDNNEETLTVNAATVVDRIRNNKANGYRLFYKNAYVTIIMDGEGEAITVGSDSQTFSQKKMYESIATVGEKTYGDKDNKFIALISVDK